MTDDDFVKVMLGYLNNEKETKECIGPDGWLRTGDVAYYDDEKCFFIVDRLKELIKVKGMQVRFDNFFSSQAEEQIKLVAHTALKQVVLRYSTSMIDDCFCFLRLPHRNWKTC